MFRLAVICPEKLARGFELTGVDVFISDSKEKTEGLLFQAIERKAGLVILPQEHLEGLEERKRKQIEELDVPLIVPVPMIREDGTKAEEYVSQLVRRAIGYEVKI